MLRMVSTLALVGALVGVHGLALGDAPRPHKGAGIVTAVSTTRIVLMQDGESHVLRVTPATRVSIAEEAGVSRIGVGDYVAEECVPDGRGGVRAVTLTLHRPAWLEISSPEN